MSNMIYPLENVIQAQVSSSNAEKADDLTIRELRVQKTQSIKSWPDTHDAVKTSLSDQLGGNQVPAIGKWAKMENFVCVCNAPGQYMLLSDSEGLDCDIDQDNAAVTDISHSRCGLIIEGKKASNLLNKGLAFPLDDEKLPIGNITQGSIHSIGVLIFKLEKDKFALLFYSSFAHSFFDWVIDSALEYGYALSERPASLFE